MRAPFALFTSLPVEWDPHEAASGWAATAAVGLALGMVWLVVHQVLIRVGGPFVAAGGVLLAHVILTGGRPLRGVAGVVGDLVDGPDDDDARGTPGVVGVVSAVLALVVVMMSGFITLSAIAPAVLVIVPLVGRSTQAVLLDDRGGTALSAPSNGQRVLIVLWTLVAVGTVPLLHLVIRPVRVDAPITGVDYLVLGVVALVVAVIAAGAWRTWLRLRFEVVDADAWHSLGAVADLTALAVVARALN